MRSIPSPHIDTTPDIICPTDHARLATWKCGYECPVCKRTYPVDEGIVRLLDCTDEFYEGAYQGQVQFVPKSE